MRRTDRRAAPWLAIAWLVGTVAAVAVTITAVQLAGSEVTTRSMASVSSQGVQQALAGDALTVTRELPDDLSESGPSLPADAEAAGDTIDDHGGDASPSGRSGSGASGSDDGAVVDDRGGSSGSSGGSGSPEGSGSSAGESSDDEGSPTPTTAAAPAATTTGPFTRTVAGGSVTVTCTADRVTLVSATAAAGWSKEVSQDSGQIEVKFERDDTEVKVRVRCNAGVPQWGS